MSESKMVNYSFNRVSKCFKHTLDRLFEIHQCDFGLLFAKVTRTKPLHNICFRAVHRYNQSARFLMTKLLPCGTS